MGRVSFFDLKLRGLGKRRSLPRLSRRAALAVQFESMHFRTRTLAAAQSCRTIACALILATVASGCVRTVTHRVAKYHPGDAPTNQPVTDVAVYKVKVYDREKKKYRGIDGTEQ